MICTVSPFALTPTSFSRIITVLDSNLGSTSVSSHETPLAVRASSSSATIFTSGADIVTYLRALEAQSTGAKVNEIDFAELKTEAGEGGKAPAEKSAKEKEKDKSLKEDAKIEGAVQIAIGVKKEADFAAWYTNVCGDNNEYIHRSSITGFAESGHAGLLFSVRLLYPEALVIYHLGSHSR